jgi:dTDP-4-dehydrorhamnose 3,5-epimerase
MIFTETEIPGAFIIDVERRSDDRGFFGRAWCAEEFAAHGLSTTFVQANIGFSARRGTLRGLHYQAAPHQEAKLVRCTRGAIYDVVVDLRPDSPAYLQWLAAELSAGNRRMLYVPTGCAHGYQTLADESEVFYPVTAAYAPGAELGVRYDDPALRIDWPLAVSAISDKDRSWPGLVPVGAGGSAGLET